MPLYQYKCFICERTEERFLPVNRRKEQFKCGSLDAFSSRDNLIECPGVMIFQPIESMKGGTFKMHDPTEKEAQG